jgi:hypothetical protein
MPLVCLLAHAGPFSPRDPLYALSETTMAEQSFDVGPRDGLPSEDDVPTEQNRLDRRAIASGSTSSGGSFVHKGVSDAPTRFITTRGTASRRAPDCRVSS